jgi:hypothetical protein
MKISTKLNFYRFISTGLLCTLFISHTLATTLEEYLPQAFAGDNAAQNRVGEIYMYGHGVPKDPIEASIWFIKASENGNPFAPNHLSVLYANGEGVEQSWETAAKWLKVSAKRGYYLAQHNLAVAYEEGNGLERDFVESYVWATLAKENCCNLNISPALRQKIVDTKERIESELTKDQLKEALSRLQDCRTTVLVIPTPYIKRERR